MDALQQKSAASRVGDIISAAAEVDGIHVVAESLEGMTQESLSSMADQIVEKLDPAVVLLASVTEGKVLLVSKASPQAVSRGAHAGNLIREIAKLCGGGGGGRPDFAQAGGKEPDKVPDALSRVPDMIRSKVKSSA